MLFFCPQHDYYYKNVFWKRFFFSSSLDLIVSQSRQTTFKKKNGLDASYTKDGVVPYLDKLSIDNLFNRLLFYVIKFYDQSSEYLS